MPHAGHLSKMHLIPSELVQASLVLDSQNVVLLNDYLGKKISIEWLGEIHCIHCGRSTKKSFNQGYCFPCSQKLAACDWCILKPELCHYAKGTCREPEWGLAHCMQPHVVYLANASGLKVGITRAENIPTRWLDQGAAQALPIIKVSSRFQSGLLEVGITKLGLKDKTDWRHMLKPNNHTIDLITERDAVLAQMNNLLAESRKQFGEDSIEVLNESVKTFSYPVLEYPEKVKSIDLEKVTRVEGRLLGIKGQYCLLDCGVINLRKYTGYSTRFLMD